MLTYREFSAWIMSEGKPLQEYLITIDSNANKVSCWIPYEAGKKFSIHWRDAGSQVHTCAFISLDGFVVPGRYLFGYGETYREGVRTGLNTERPFMFALPSNTLSTKEQTNQDVGTIVLKIRRIYIEGPRAANKPQQLPNPEHCISYGEERRTYEQHPTTWNLKPYDGSGNRSYVTFTFWYRFLNRLVLQDIILANDGKRKPQEAQEQKESDQVTSASFPAGSSLCVSQSTNKDLPERDQVPVVYKELPGHHGCGILDLSAREDVCRTG